MQKQNSIENYYQVLPTKKLRKLNWKQKPQQHHKHIKHKSNYSNSITWKLWKQEHSSIKINKHMEQEHKNNNNENLLKSGILKQYLVLHCDCLSYYNRYNHLFVGDCCIDKMKEKDKNHLTTESHFITNSS